jgi:hypothetical protein
MRADLLVVTGDQNRAFRAVIDADPANVQLVIIGGVPVYGALTFLKRFWAATGLEEIRLPGGPKVLATAASGFLVSAVAERLTNAMAIQGTFLAPLIESEN